LPASRHGILLRELFQRIGHGGASALAPGNTLAAFDVALEHGVDMIEFDVRAWRGQLVLAHTHLHAGWGRAIRLDEALSHLASPRFSEVGVNVDVKHPGCEDAILAALRNRGLLDRTLLSSQVPGVIDRLRAREPAARLGISVGGRISRLGRCWIDWRAHVLAGLASGRWHALMAQHRLVDERLLEQVAAREGRLYAWTVNDRASIASLRELGVHGVTTADPRLFWSVDPAPALVPA